MNMIFPFILTSHNPLACMALVHGSIGFFLGFTQNFKKIFKQNGPKKYYCENDTVEKDPADLIWPLALPLNSLKSNVTSLSRVERTTRAHNTLRFIVSWVLTVNTKGSLFSVAIFLDFVRFHVFLLRYSLFQWSSFPSMKQPALVLFPLLYPYYRICP